MEFIERHFPSFEKVSDYDDNHPGERVKMFTILTQHIYARCATEAIDMGIEMEKTKRVREDIRNDKS